MRLLLPAIAVAVTVIAIASPSRSAATGTWSQPPKTIPRPKPALTLPNWWNRDDPLPRVESNCMRCHLTAGRELTAAVRDFARSAHDRQMMTCNDCHGGDTENDERAHDESSEFIGTKRSSHLQNCSECHTEESDRLSRGPHAWDFSKRINTKYPHCIDCHGNHDVGNPPDDFRLVNVCKDCHQKFTTENSAYARVVTESDRLGATLHRVRTELAKRGESPGGPLRDEIAAVRYQTMRVMHLAGPLTDDQAGRIIRQIGQLERRLRAEKP